MSTCQYSFQDLFDAAGIKLDKSFFYGSPRQVINEYVKELCKIANWDWEDRVGTDGVVYTAFAPSIDR